VNEAAFHAESIFLIFCRIGTCLLLLPGPSYGRIPGRFRIWLAIAISLSTITTTEDLPRLTISILFSEIIIGIFLGLIVRILVSAMSFAGAAIGGALGLIGGQSALQEDQDVSTAIGDLLVLTATVFIVCGSAFGEILNLLTKIYIYIPLGGLAWSDASSVMRTLTSAASAGFLLAMHLAAPFIILSILINAGLGLANRMVPQLPVQFIGGPLLVGSGLLLMEQGLNALIGKFVVAISLWLNRL
jgi:flagellar biosynthetic protein FliR